MQNFQYNLPKKFSSVQPTYAHKSSSYPNMKNNVSSNGHRHSVGSVTLQNQLLSSTPNQQHSLKSNMSSYNNCSPNYYENNINPLHVHFQDFNSHKEQKSSQNVDIESSLESLCLQMMEHALGP